MESFGIDYSTLNVEKLEKFKMYKKPSSFDYCKLLLDTNHVFCAGYPNLFSSIVNKWHSWGNEPVCVVLTYQNKDYLLHKMEHDDGSFNWEYNLKIVKQILEDLYIPLPLSHIRTQMWIQNVLWYWKNQYWDEEKQNYVSHITPPYDMMKHPIFGEMYTNIWADYIKNFRPEMVAVDKKMGVRKIRERYPEYEYTEIDMSKTPGNWWEIHNRYPLVDECPRFDYHNSCYSCVFCGR